MTVLKSDVRQQTVTPKVCCLRPLILMFFLVYQCFLLITGTWEIILFIWIELLNCFTIRQKCWCFLTKVSLEVKVFYFIAQKQKFTHKLATAGFSSVFTITNMQGFFFSFFQKYFSFRNSTLAFKNYSCADFSCFHQTSYLHSGSEINLFVQAPSGG